MAIDNHFIRLAMSPSMIRPGELRALLALAILTLFEVALCAEVAAASIKGRRVPRRALLAMTPVAWVVEAVRALQAVVSSSVNGSDKRQLLNL